MTLQVSDHQAFDILHNPGVPAPYSGIYRCEVCGREVGSIQKFPLPPQKSSPTCGWTRADPLATGGDPHVIGSACSSIV